MYSMATGTSLWNSSSMRQLGTTVKGINPRSGKLYSNSLDGKQLSQYEWSGRGTDCHLPSLNALSYLI